jgi:hypothetical protein
MEGKLSNDFTPKPATEVEYGKLSREELLALLRGVTEQRDEALSQFEAMALQIDECGRDIAEAQLEERYDAKRAEDNEHHAEQEAAHANELSRQLEEERHKSAEIAAEFARFRDAIDRAPVEDPWGVLGRAVSQIVSDGVVWGRARIPLDSSLLPWFDRAVELAKTTGRLLFKWAKVFIEWAKPHVVYFWRWLKSEVAKRMNKEKGGPASKG